MAQQMMPERKKRRKKGEKLAFDAGKVFEPKAAEEVEVELDRESSTYRAQKGEGGDRRA